MRLNYIFNFLHYAIIVLMSEQDEQEVEIRRISDNPEDETFKVHRIDAESVTAIDTFKKQEPGEKVKIKFANFVNLVASHDFQKVINKHSDEDIVVSTNLLADLANAHEDKEEKKLPVIFAVGLIAGIILTYLLFRY